MNRHLISYTPSGHGIPLGRIPSRQERRAFVFGAIGGALAWAVATLDPLPASGLTADFLRDNPALHEAITAACQRDLRLFDPVCLASQRATDQGRGDPWAPLEGGR